MFVQLSKGVAVMKVLAALYLGASLLVNAAPTDSIRALADRFLDGKGAAFEFALSDNKGNWSRWNAPTNDDYTVTATKDGKIHVEGTTLSALARGYEQAFQLLLIHN